MKLFTMQFYSHSYYLFHFQSKYVPMLYNCILIQYHKTDLERPYIYQNTKLEVDI
jgi:hypothetical protein